MFDNVKLIEENRKLRRKINKLELDIELLKDEKIDELIQSLDKKNHYEELEKEIEKLKIKIQALKEVIREIGNEKKKS